MHFQVKNILKNNCIHTFKQAYNNNLTFWLAW